MPGVCIFALGRATTLLRGSEPRRASTKRRNVILRSLQPKPLSSDQNGETERISATERSGSITALGVLLGFSIAILDQWSNRPEPWTFASAIPLILFGSSVFLQVLALYRALQVPRELQPAHRMTIKLAMSGLIVMFAGFLSTILIDIVAASNSSAPASTPH